MLGPMIKPTRRLLIAHIEEVLRDLLLGHKKPAQRYCRATHRTYHHNSVNKATYWCKKLYTVPPISATLEFQYS
jgi:hypothetical protein